MLLTITSVHRADLSPLAIELYVCHLDDGVLMLSRERERCRAVIRDAPDCETERFAFDAELAAALWELLSNACGKIRPGERATIEVRYNDSGCERAFAPAALPASTRA